MSRGKEWLSMLCMVLVVGLTVIAVALTTLEVTRVESGSEGHLVTMRVCGVEAKYYIENN